MSEAALDPYAVLGVAHDVSDIELRRIYRGLVKRHHPDHNGGSAESAARFAQIQNAYDQIAHHRSAPPQPPRAPQPPPAPPPPTPPPRAAPGDPDIEDRVAMLEREMAAMRKAAQRRAQEQQQEKAQQRRPTPEELGYYTTDDSFTRIVDDAAEQLGERLRKSDAKRQFSRRLSDLFGRDD